MIDDGSTNQEIDLTNEALAIARVLKPHDVKALRILVRRAIGEFEPIGAMPGLGQIMIDRFIEHGLAEQGVSNAYTGSIGYRATKLGHAVFAELSNRRDKPTMGVWH